MEGFPFSVAASRDPCIDVYRTVEPDAAQFAILPGDFPVRRKASPLQASSLPLAWQGVAFDQGAHR